MKQSFINFIKNNLLNLRFRNEISVFIICFVSASLIWFLIKLSKEYYSSIDFPVTYVNLPVNKQLISKTDTVLTLRLKVQGYKLVSLKLFTEKRPIKISLSNIKLKNEQKGIYKTNIAVSQISHQILNHLKYVNEIESISPDTLFFVFEDIVKKKIPVKLKLNLSFEKQYQLYEPIELTPDSVIISGPKTIIRNIKYIESEEKEFIQLNDNKSIELSLQSPSKKKGINLSSKKIQVKIHVERFTEANLELPIISISDENEFKIKTFPEKVKITYMVALKDFKNVYPELFTANVNCKNINKGNNKKLKIDITQKPNFINITKIEPEEVEYIILK